ncbi:hypothetical protein [Methanosarcina sp.]|uniref:hypothetical protein n=1 Tax=Methanosarcina sp. TaxID=2213 RepID=UPI002ABAF213|nr:hypothetical protein [Methanosarcina sp.]MDY9925496.1 hypothetical protein [Methanosarcina sp.]
MARCLTNEIWQAYFLRSHDSRGNYRPYPDYCCNVFLPGGVSGLDETISAGGAALLVKNVSLGLLGPAGNKKEM